MNKDNLIITLAIATLLIVMLLPYAGIKFAISDNDFVYVGQSENKALGILPENFSIDNGSIVMNSLGITFIPGSNYYQVGDSNVYSLTFPDTTQPGNYTITKYQFFVGTDNQSVYSKTWSTIYTKEISIQNITQNVTVNQTVYVDRNVTVNQTVNQTVYVDKEVKVEPTFLEKYGLAGVIFIVLGSIIIYLIYKKSK